ncbi:hypothetical protein CCR75_008623 [Bremia lactucae]|uniref:Uncharacterized protein n=1 Tax=Bremia lactucae TaxID=4779 RepID=A0A976NYS5_BRELC|nr:hypothetical protein CCR75_008623 [Bremia lactucae]
METRIVPEKTSPVKSQFNEHTDRTSLHIAVSSSKSCTQDVEEQLESWERSPRVASSYKSESLWKQVTNEAVDVDPDNVSSLGKTSIRCTQASKMRTHLRGMQLKLEALHRLILEAKQQRKMDLCLQMPTVSELLSKSSAAFDTCAGVSTCHYATLLSAGELVRSEIVSAFEHQELCDAATPIVNDSRKIHAISKEGFLTTISLLGRLSSLQTELEKTSDENHQLQNKVSRLEKENAFLKTGQNFHSSVVSLSKDKALGMEDKDIDSYSRLTVALYGEPSTFQIVMEKDLAVLKNHKHCKHKLHELWTIIRKLRLFVEAHRLERDTMRLQRDDAVADAKRADAKSVQLACSNNPQQKIRYLQQIKSDNQALRQKNCMLNVRVAKQAAKLTQLKKGCSLLDEHCETPIDTSLESLMLDEMLRETRDESDVRPVEIFLHNTRHRSELLEQRLESLRFARQQLSANITNLESAMSASQNQRVTTNVSPNINLST